MKKALLIVFLIYAGTASAQTVVVSDSFDTYTAGSMLAATSPLWITWSGLTTQDAAVDSTQASSEPNSVYIMGNAGPTDIMLPFPLIYTTGVFELTMKMFIVTGKGGYFNLQASNIPAVDWMLEVYFDNAGGGSVNAGASNAASANYIPNTWNDIRVNVDLTNDVAQLYINNALIHSWQWSLGSDGAGAPLSWGGLNLYASASSPGDAEYYVDDVVLTDLTPTGVDDVKGFSDVKVFPNPSNGNFEMSFFSPVSTDANLQFFNMTGEKVAESYQKVNAGFNSCWPVVSLPAGIYFLQFIAEENSFTQKIVIGNRITK